MPGHERRSPDVLSDDRESRKISEIETDFSEIAVGIARERDRRRC
jgi:hypothetical protein